jgi:hypothetical protein
MKRKQNHAKEKKKKKIGSKLINLKGLLRKISQGCAKFRVSVNIKNFS